MAGSVSASAGCCAGPAVAVRDGGRVAGPGVRGAAVGVGVIAQRVGGMARVWGTRVGTVVVGVTVGFGPPTKAPDGRSKTKVTPLSVRSVT
jgi:hypothetical protein